MKVIKYIIFLLMLIPLQVSAQFYAVILEFRLANLIIFYIFVPNLLEFLPDINNNKII